MRHVPGLRLYASFSIALFATSLAQAQSSQQVVKPPKMLLWMDASTGTMAGMADMDIPGVGGLMGMMGGLGGKGNADAKTTSRSYYGGARGFGISPPRILDIAFWNSLKPGVEVAQRVPSGLKLGDKLPLLPILPDKVSQGLGPGEEYKPDDKDKPKGRLLFYWGCSTTVRTGQPRIIDLSKITADNAQVMGLAFNGRFAPDRGAKVAAGYDVFPNERDQRSVPKGGSLAGEHQVNGDTVPDSFKFTLGATQDIMPPIELQSQGNLKESVALSWGSVPNARGYFLHAMGGQGDDMIFWASSDVPDTGFGMFDFLSNGTIDKWIKDKVLLAPSVSQCAVPKGIFGPKDGAGTKGREEGGAMLRMIAYGGEHSIVHPPRPTDVKVAWEQEWAVRLRLKTQTMAMLGESFTTERNSGAGSGATSKSGDAPAKPADNNPLNALPVPDAVNLIKGFFK
jgi:hypothetical protein